MNSFRFLFFFYFCPRIKSAPGSPISHYSVGNVYGADSVKMTFILRKEDKFLRNIYDREVLKESKSLESIENCFVAFQKFVNLPVLSLISVDLKMILSTLNIKMLLIFEENITKIVKVFLKFMMKLVKLRLKIPSRKHYLKSWRR